MIIKSDLVRETEDKEAKLLARKITRQCKRRYNRMISYLVDTQKTSSIVFPHNHIDYKIAIANGKSKAFRWSTSRGAWISSLAPRKALLESIQYYYESIYPFKEEEWT